MINIGLADDHNLFRTGITTLINDELGLKVTIEAESGEEFLELIKKNGEPDIAIVDIKMNGMSGFELTEKLSKYHPKIKVIALSMFMDEDKIIKMLKCGATTYLLKGSEPWELIQAINSTFKYGRHASHVVSEALFNQAESEDEFSFKPNELIFIHHCCSELTYKEIAKKMKLSFRTIDGYRDKVFSKLKVKNRVGIVLFAIKNKIFSMDDLDNE